VDHPSRRAILKGAVALAALPSIVAFTDRRLSPVRMDPFTLGVASGDPGPDGVVIWTRLAPNPLADDGFGGMPARAFEVE
jgi:alkaline phosphatase D